MQEIIERIVPVPHRCSWEITLACNLNCIHCGSAAGYCRENELTTDEALDVCDQLANLGCKEVTLLGGEPFLRKDWHLISQRLISHDIDVKIVSNGILHRQMNKNGNFLEWHIDKRRACPKVERYWHKTYGYQP